MYLILVYYLKRRLIYVMIFVDYRRILNNYDCVTVKSVTEAYEGSQWVDVFSFNFKLLAIF